MEVNVLGGEIEYAMRVWLDPEKMANLNITTSDVNRALAEQNVQVAAGRIGAPYNSLPARKYNSTW
ncbi:efflux RND transporter permease subunit [Vibrio chagasii]|nr:efflux RND transporter permease subunit [Vibrio chagasii]